MNLSDRLRTRVWPRFADFAQRFWAVTVRSLIKFDETDGEQRAASFAYYAFFAMFPLILLLITIGSTFIGDQQAAATNIITYVGNYIPGLGTGEGNVVVNTLQGVANSRRSAGVIAFCVLAWSALRFFQALVRGVNRAWGTKEYSWWRLPIKNLFMVAILASALLLGIVAPLVLKQIKTLYWLHSHDSEFEFPFVYYLFSVAELTIPLLVLFYGLSMFYMFAPRRRTSFREIWGAAVTVTLLLQILQRGFVLYTVNIGNFNALYGTFGSVVALLLWIYLSGSLIILGGCISAAQYEVRLHIADQSESGRARA
jgi:Ca2+-transporting ATPase